MTGSPAAGGELRFTHGQPSSLVISVDTADRPRSVAWTVRAYAWRPVGWPAQQQDSSVRGHSQGWVTLLAWLRDYLSRQHAGRAR